MSQVVYRSMSAILKAVSAAVRLVASEEIMPCYIKLSHQRKLDVSPYHEAYEASQHVLSKKLQALINAPVLTATMNESQRTTTWDAGHEELWCICPIDNQSNFVRGLPFFAVSASLLRNGRSVLSVVYDPVADELFAAEKGKGAFLNSEKMLVRETTQQLDQALASVHMHYLNNQLCIQLSNQTPYAAQRNFGASALDWCYTAAGRYDVYLHGAQSLWDYAAGWLILQEAGGHSCCLDNDDFSQANVWKRSVIAARDEKLFNEWKHWLRSNS